MKDNSIDEGRQITDVSAPIVNSFISPVAADTSRLGRIAEALNIVSPVAQTYLSKLNDKQAAADALKATALAKEIQGAESTGDRDKDMKKWAEATRTNPDLLALNPHAQRKARRDIAAASALQYREEVEEMALSVTSDISGEDDYVNFTTKINAIRSKALSDLEITDPEEISAFNNRFNQLEQNFTAQFNSAQSSLKAKAADDRLMASAIYDVGNIMKGTVGSEYIPSKGSQQVIDRASGIAGMLKRAISEDERHGLLGRDRRMQVSKAVVLKALVQGAQGNEQYTIDMIEKGNLLGQIQFPIDGGKPFNLKDTEGGDFQSKVIQELQGNLKRRTALTAVNTREQQQVTKDTFSAAAFKIASENSPVEQFALYDNLIKEYAGTEDLMGANWNQDMQKLVDLAIATRDNVTERNADLGAHMPNFAAWQVKLADKTIDSSTWTLEVAKEVADGTLTPSEARTILTENKLRGVERTKTLLAPARTATDRKLKILLAGGDYANESTYDLIVNAGVHEFSSKGTMTEEQITHIRIVQANIVDKRLEITVDTPDEEANTTLLEIDALVEGLRGDLFSDKTEDVNGVEVTATVEGLVEKFTNDGSFSIPLQELNKLKTEDRAIAIDRMYSPINLKKANPDLSVDKAEEIYGYVTELLETDLPSKFPKTFSDGMSKFAKLTKNLQAYTDAEALLSTSELPAQESLAEAQNAQARLESLKKEVTTVNASLGNLFGKGDAFSPKQLTNLLQTSTDSTSILQIADTYASRLKNSDPVKLQILNSNGAISEILQMLHKGEAASNFSSEIDVGWFSNAPNLEIHPTSKVQKYLESTSAPLLYQHGIRVKYLPGLPNKYTMRYASNSLQAIVKMIASDQADFVAGSIDFEVTRIENNINTVLQPSLTAQLNKEEEDAKQRERSIIE